MTRNDAPTTDQIADTVLAAFRTELDSEVRPGDSISELSSIDSVKLMRLITRIEDHYDISLDDDTVFTVTTVGDLVDLITTTVAGKQ
ncbi:acyl carrier protein [Nocardia wallacei]|uniref:acyl carrier protein n=1 Tax=Nocardia wallacei TaxID=480035 RepID=UPI002457442E|nr:acyl carrier protein [Nocardia wallacei]